MVCPLKSKICLRFSRESFRVNVSGLLIEHLLLALVEARVPIPIKRRGTKRRVLAGGTRVDDCAIDRLQARI